MNPLFLIIIIVCLLLISILYVRKKIKKSITKTSEGVAGICAFALDQLGRKNKNKVKILKLFEGKKELSNFEIREALRVSSRTVVRYLDELEEEEKVEQVGKIGHNVIYRLK